MEYKGPRRSSHWLDRIFDWAHGFPLQIAAKRRVLPWLCLKRIATKDIIYHFLELNLPHSREKKMVKELLSYPKGRLLSRKKNGRLVKSLSFCPIIILFPKGKNSNSLLQGQQSRVLDQSFDWTKDMISSFRQQPRGEPLTWLCLQGVGPEG